MIRASIIGATGYVGEELVRILSRHPEVTLRVLTSESYTGQKLADVYPNLGPFGDITCRELNLQEIVEDSDVVFTALPHGIPMEITPKILGAGVKLIDMGPDFRLKPAATYEEWYKHRHACPELLERAVYGLPELHREDIKRADLVANPGCYPTSAILGAAPLLRSGVVDLESIIIDAKSGVSGAGRAVSLGVHFSEVNDNLRAYNIAGSHRHTPEIEQQMSTLAGRELKVSFTPHLIPMTRGILSTIYLGLERSLDTNAVIELYREFYRHEPFVRVLGAGQLPQTKHVYGSNFCHIGLQVDGRTNRVLVVSVIDNLVKGAAGQAVQNMNLMFGLPEDTGLCYPGIFP